MTLAVLGVLSMAGVLEVLSMLEVLFVLSMVGVLGILPMSSQRWTRVGDGNNNSSLAQGAEGIYTI